MNKLYALVVILGFWLILPIPFAIMDISDKYTSDNMDSLVSSIDSQSPSNLNDMSGLEKFFTGIGSIVGFVWTIISTYFIILTIGIPNVPSIINYFLVLLKLISISVIIMILRGN